MIRQQKLIKQEGDGIVNLQSCVGQYRVAYQGAEPRLCSQ